MPTCRKQHVLSDLEVISHGTWSSAQSPQVAVQLITFSSVVLAEGDSNAGYDRQAALRL
jgi:hypothetical protein